MQTNHAQSIKIPSVEFPREIFTLYLSHPFASRHKVREWEEKFEEGHPHIALLNPFYDVEGEGREDVRAKDAGRMFEADEGYNFRLVRRDLIALSYSRGILSVVDDNCGVSVGTLMETVYGRVLDLRPKLLICTNENLKKHPWLCEHYDKIYHSFKGFEEDAEAQVAKVIKEKGF